jgi:hypothetical protein
VGNCRTDEADWLTIRRQSRVEVGRLAATVIHACGIGRGGPAAAYVCVMNGTNPRRLTRIAGIN